jgi:hypothetical protein
MTFVGGAPEERFGVFEAVTEYLSGPQIATWQND